MTFVVDTNVAMAANGRETHADARCQLACVERLKSLAAGEVVAIDDRGLILHEYRGRLNLSGMPGVGDVFLKHVFNRASCKTLGRQGFPTRGRGNSSHHRRRGIGDTGSQGTSGTSRSVMRASARDETWRISLTTRSSSRLFSSHSW